MCSELGDVLLQVLFHAVIAEERGAFDIRDVAGSLVAKMTRRHPWLYAEQQRDNRETTERQQYSSGGSPTIPAEPWEAMKSRGRKSLAEGLPQGLPSPAPRAPAAGAGGGRRV